MRVTLRRYSRRRRIAPKIFVSFPSALPIALSTGSASSAALKKLRSPSRSLARSHGRPSPSLSPRTRVHDELRLLQRDPRTVRRQPCSNNGARAVTRECRNRAELTELARARSVTAGLIRYARFASAREESQSTVRGAAPRNRGRARTLYFYF